ncbi:MAG TPA: hypothetical protein VEI02_02250, partial [Planctomycetota bacterium]|nr:hypothetical protein [Planctomycetota bacterium]
MTSAPRERLVLVGPGRAGTSLLRAWRDRGHRTAALAGGSAASRAAARAEVGDAAEVPVADALGAGSLIVIATPDDRLDDVVAELARGDGRGALALHLCGGRPAAALAPLAAAGARIAAFHPLKAFADRAGGRAGLGG